MSTTQIIEKNVDGKCIYECSGDYGYTLSIVETDPLFAKIKDTLAEADEIVKRLMEERKAETPVLQDSVIVTVDDNNIGKIYSLQYNAKANTDASGVIRIGDWLIIARRVAADSDKINLLIYRPDGVIEDSKFVVYEDIDVIKVDFLVRSDNQSYIELSKYPKTDFAKELGIEVTTPEYGIADAEIVEKPAENVTVESEEATETKAEETTTDTESAEK